MMYEWENGSDEDVFVCFFAFPQMYVCARGCVFRFGFITIAIIYSSFRSFLLVS